MGGRTSIVAPPAAGWGAAGAPPSQPVAGGGPASVGLGAAPSIEGGIVASRTPPASGRPPPPAESGARAASFLVSAPAGEGGDLVQPAPTPTWNANRTDHVFQRRCIGI